MGKSVVRENRLQRTRVRIQGIVDSWHLSETRVHMELIKGSAYGAKLNGNRNQPKKAKGHSEPDPVA